MVRLHGSDNLTLTTILTQGDSVITTSVIATKVDGFVKT